MARDKETNGLSSVLLVYQVDVIRCCLSLQSAKPGMPLDLRYAISALLFTEPSVGDNW